MRKMKLSIFILLAIISSFLFADNVKAYVKSTDSITNTFTLKRLYNVTVSYYSVLNGNKTMIQNPDTISEYSGNTINLTTLIPSDLQYDNVEFYINGNLYTGGNNYTIQGVTTIEIDLSLSEYSYLYRNPDPITFDGVDDYLDTGINVQNSDTLDIDYLISFDLIYVDPDNATSGEQQPTIYNAKDESYNLYPGYVVRLLTGNASYVYINSRWNDTRVNRDMRSSNVPIHFEFKRIGGVVTAQYSYSGYDSGVVTLYNQANWQVTQYTTDNITFGARVMNGQYDRFFKGTIDNVVVAVYK